MRTKLKKWVLPTPIFILLYVLLGNAKSVQENPFIPDATLAINMIIPIIAAILFGWQAGLFTGFLGTTINAIFYDLLEKSSAIFEYMAILPHAIMGFLAGYLKDKLPTPILAGFIAIGHILNIIIFTLMGLIPLDTLYNLNFWYGIGYEIFIDMIVIIIIVSIYKLMNEEKQE